MPSNSLHKKINQEKSNYLFTINFCIKWIKLMLCLIFRYQLEMCVSKVVITWCVNVNKLGISVFIVTVIIFTNSVLMWKFEYY